MVILQFNKLIRNKWIWGVFAIAISLFFAFDFLVADLNDDRGREDASGSAGVLAGEKVSAKAFQPVVDDIRGFGRNRDWQRKAGEINRQAWENYATLVVAEKNGIGATPADVQMQIRNDRNFAVNGQFSFDQYQRLLLGNSIAPERYEDAVRRSLTLERVSRLMLGGAAWASPMELDQEVADMTDVFTVRVARFTQDAKAAAAVKLDDAGLRKWYDDHVKSLELPERTKIRFVKYDATAKDILAKMKVTEAEIQDQFDITADKYTTKDTNGVEKVKKFSELTKAEKDGIERELRQVAAVQCFETNLNQRVYAKKPAKGVSRLDEIAKEDGRKAESSDWFAVDGSFKEGFMRRATQILPGAKGFAEAVAELDSSSEDLRYAVISSDRAVWLIEKIATSPKHTPKFEEAKDAIRPQALRDAKADAFKATVEAVAKGGAKAVLAVKDISTNITFSVSDLQQGGFPDQYSVARAAMRLHKGEVSEFTLTMPGRALLVVCQERTEGDAAKAMMLKTQVREGIAMMQLRQLAEKWQKWNLEKLGFKPDAAYSPDISDEAE